MFERFTKAARESVVRAQEESAALRCDHLGSEHLLLAVLADRTSISARVLADYDIDYDNLRAVLAEADDTDTAALAAIGIDLRAVRARAEAVFGPGALDRPTKGRRKHRPIDAAARKALELSLREAIALGHKEITTEHLLLGLLRDDRAESVQVLRRLGYAEDFAVFRSKLATEMSKAA